jgi:transglutaminase-like putative cysteine protease
MQENIAYNCVYKIVHTTKYLYPDLVNQSFSEVKLSPRNTSFQTCLSSDLRVLPECNNLVSREDFFGNNVKRFSVFRPHKTLEITNESKVLIKSRNTNDLEHLIKHTWLETRNILAAHHPHLLDAKQFILDSPFTAGNSCVADFVNPIFRKESNMLNLVNLLMSSIYHQFEFKAGATNISTPIQEVMKNRKGVCQDFAHIAIASLRYMGLAAKYVSGYIETLPPKGEAKLTGADASHAWVAVYIPDFGWLEFDPTNNLLVDSKHITLAYGRDYGDVAPVKGVVYSDGEQQLETSVDVELVETV